MTAREVYDRDMESIVYHVGAILAHTERATKIATEYRTKSWFGFTHWRMQHAMRMGRAILRTVELLGQAADNTGTDKSLYAKEKVKRMLKIAEKKANRIEKERMQREQQSG